MGPSFVLYLNTFLRGWGLPHPRGVAGEVGRG